MKLSIVAALCTAALCLPAAAQVKVEGAWARPTVSGQQGGGGFMTLTSERADRLLGGSTPAAERVEFHTMAMEGDMMRMRQLDKLELKAGQKLEFKPGGLHAMFIGLKRPLTVGAKLPVTLMFERAGEVKVEMTVMARPAPTPEHKH